MSVAAAVASAVLAGIFVLSARAKLARDPAQVETLAAVGVKDAQLAPLATLEIAAAAGLLAGIVWAPIGIAAAAGAVAYFVGALTAHFRARHYAITPPAVLLGLSVATLVLCAAAA